MENFRENMMELVHVMLKPDALERGLEDVLVKELVRLGGILVYEVPRYLNIEQISTIYYDFAHERARDFVFTYLTSNQTLHLGFLGETGLHDIFNNAKGITGGTSGIRAKYIKEYIQMSIADLEKWKKGDHERQVDIDLEMFCRNLLHVAPNKEASIRGLLCII